MTNKSNESQKVTPFVVSLLVSTWIDFKTCFGIT